jgi:hypothetical protein
MIVGFDEIPKLSKEVKRLIAEFGGSRHFDAIKELIEHDLIVNNLEVINNPSTANDHRLELIGENNGIIKLLQRVRQIQSEVFEQD